MPETPPPTTPPTTPTTPTTPADTALVLPRVGPVQWLRSLVFVAQVYLAMTVVGVIFVPLTLWRRDMAFRAVHYWCRYVRWSAGWMVGLKTEIRGEVPRGEVIVASKHQSFFDIILICSALPRPKFIMKKELLRVPILGWFALQIGCVPVDRGKRGRAVQAMVAAVREGLARQSAPGQLIIYPQGTRVAPGQQADYKPGTGILYAQLGHVCVPAATNVGLFWPKGGVWRRPGTAVVEFLPPITPGLSISHFMTELEAVIETASDRLIDEAAVPGVGLQRRS